MTAADIRAELNILYNGCDCHSHEHLPTMSMTDDWASALAKMVAEVWDKKGMPLSISKEITELFAGEITKAIEDGYGVQLAAFDFTTPDRVMINDLLKNVYQFSAAKNYAQLKALTQALVDDNGLLRTFAEFKKVAFEINNEHVNQWLKTEYNTAVASAQMARKWVEIQNNKSFAPLLQLDVVMDGRTSEICRPLDGVIKPVADPFWDIYYPPNHFGCRSAIKQLRSGVVSTNVEQPEIPAMFRTNMAKTGAAFPAKHPYFIGAPQHVFNTAGQLFRDKFRKNE